MAIASSLFSPKSLLARFRNPVFIASALSLGAHGVFFAAMPMLSASEDLQDKEDSVPVVALSPEEAQRLPDAVRNGGSSTFFGNDPFATQQGESLLPVPGIPPYGDLTGLDSSFNDPLPTTSPLWGNPVDIFQDSLPALPGDTSVIFPNTNSFDSFGTKPYDVPLGNSSALNESTVALRNNDAPVLEDDFEQVIPEKTDAPAPVASEDKPLINGSDEVPGSGLEAPLVSSVAGTTVANAFGGEEETASKPVDPNQLAAETSAAGDESTTSPTEPSQGQSQSVASNDPALVALRAEQQRLRDGYRNNGSGPVDIGQTFADLGELGTAQSLALKPAQTLVVQYPDSKCPADALPALFNLVTQADGNILAPALVQSTQYPALDAAAQETAAKFAADLTEAGVYQLSVEFQDTAGRCLA